MPKDKKINIRLTEKEKSIIEVKAKKFNMTITKFIISSCLKDKIVIVNGLDRVDTELRRIGNNINQLTRLANEKIITVIDLKELRMEVNNIWQLLKQLVQKQNANLITGKDCLAESCLEEMLYTKNIYHKNSGRQYIHIIQSFDPKDSLSAKQVHNIGTKLASTFNGFQVLVATHIDKNHLHNHLVINSVSFENGYKIQMSKKDLQYIKDYSDKLCLEIGASVIPKKEKTNYIKRNEYRVAEQGKSWKFKLMNTIDLSLAESNCKDDFIKNMNKLGYQVNWTDTRKYITYTTPEGYKCRDNKKKIHYIYNT